MPKGTRELFRFKSAVETGLYRPEVVHQFFFVDLSLELDKGSQDSLEGVWGRTTCISSLEPIDHQQYDLHGELLATEFPKSLFEPIL